jgi:hypothetical protein
LQINTTTKSCNFYNPRGKKILSRITFNIKRHNKEYNVLSLKRGWYNLYLVFEDLFRPSTVIDVSLNIFANKKAYNILILSKFKNNLQFNKK